AAGAFDLIAKPGIGEGLDGFAAQLVAKVEAATAASTGRQGAAGAGAPVPPRGRRVLRPQVAKAVLIATSTGGPKALAALLPNLPAPLGIGPLIVQHMPPGFTRSLAGRLNQSAQLEVREAEGGEILDPRVALIAPGGKHLRVAADGRTQLTEEPEIGALRPRADLTIKDAAEVFGERTLLVVMTGMGSDGLIGARAVRQH